MLYNILLHFSKSQNNEKIQGKTNFLKFCWFTKSNYICSRVLRNNNNIKNSLLGGVPIV